ncbi:MAG TPA: hypothetical protein VGN64_04540 [Dyadobacter sp.]|jgi:hypothetical protein|nr:hypothetical protein [Dyadobacter sp.]
MKNSMLAIFMIVSVTAIGQDQALKKGNAVYVEANKSDVGQSAAQELASALKEWGYWNVTASKSGADFVLKLDSRVSGGVTWTSWGGKSVALSASMLDKKGEQLWQSEYYKASPNGANGYNSQSASVKKLTKAIKRKFDR